MVMKSDDLEVFLKLLRAVEDKTKQLKSERKDLAQALLAVAHRDSRSYHEVSKRRDIMALSERIVHGETLNEAMEDGKS